MMDFIENSNHSINKYRPLDRLLENRSSADSHLIGYRPDIDGLRAIAVLSVIVFHLSRSILPGGYLGVDVFFVLSGYLITLIIWREISVDSYSIVRFYDRRLRRIMPALLAVLFVTIIASALVLLPIDFIGYAKSIFATLAFVSNVYFWRDTNYFSRTAEEKPLLHLWSLGVEEQFYVLFPLLLILLAKKARARAPIYIAALCLGSFIINILAFKVGGNAPAFYLLPTRAWELGAGAFLALTSVKPLGQRTTFFLGYTGLLMLVFGIASGNTYVHALIPEALPVVIGTCLLIFAGANKQHLVSRALSSSALVFVGLISYSLYLWHWPIIVLTKYYLVRDLTVMESATIFAVTIFVAVLSWRYIERPFRSTKVSISRVRYVALAGLAIAAISATTIIGYAGFPQRLNPAAAQINAAVGTNYRCPMTEYLYFEQSRACVLELPSRNPDDADIVLLGNSHAQMYAPVFRDIFRDLSLKGLLVPANGCLPTYDANINPECIELANRNIDSVAKLKRARIVILGTTWDNDISNINGLQVPPQRTEAIVEGLDRTISRLIASGKKVILIGPISTPNWDVASITSRNLAFGKAVGRPLYGSIDSFNTEFSSAIAHFEHRKDIAFIRPDLVQCQDGKCSYIVDGRSLFADDNHFAAAELYRFQPIFESAIKRILAAN